MSRMTSPGWMASRSSGMSSIGRSGAAMTKAAAGAARAGSLRHAADGGRGADISQRQIEREGAAHAGRAAQMDLPAKQVGQLAADGEAQAGAAVLAAGAGVGLLEGLEDDLLLLDRNADAGIGDLERHHRRRLVEHRMLRAPTAHRRRDVEPHAALGGELEVLSATNSSLRPALYTPRSAASIPAMPSLNTPKPSIPKSAPDFTIDQHWERYSAAEHGVWRTLFERQAKVLPGRACAEFLDGLQAEARVRPHSRFRARCRTRWRS